MVAVRAIFYLSNKIGKLATPDRLTTFGEIAKERTEQHTFEIGGVTIPVMQVYRVFDSNYPETIGPGFVVSKRPPMHNWVANVSFDHAEIK